jgi:hypothetical protein
MPRGFLGFAVSLSLVNAALAEDVDGFQLGALHKSLDLNCIIEFNI